jgi:hypothetical protein
MNVTMTDQWSRLDSAITRAEFVSSTSVTDDFGSHVRTGARHRVSSPPTGTKGSAPTTATTTSSTVELSRSDWQNSLTGLTFSDEAPPPGRPVQPAAANGLVTGLSKWEGLILDIEGGLFSAELTPLDHSGPVLVANFETKLLLEQVDSLYVGDMFYLTTRQVSDGKKTLSTSILRLRRLGVWTQEELQAARDRARSFVNTLETDAD